MTPEQRFIGKLRDKICDGQTAWTRIENATGYGIPDIVIVRRGVTTWLEAKFGIGMLLRKEQYAWGMRYATCGARVLVVLGRTDGTVSVWKYPFEALPRNHRFVVPADVGTNMEFLDFIASI